MLTSVRIFTLTLSCLEAPPCTPVLLTVCRRKSLLLLLHHQDQDPCSSREEILRLDRRFHPCFPLHLPADVDLQAGIRRVRPIHCPPQVLLSFSTFHLH